ncbi:MAG: DNA-processing protein DprA [Oscillospiraceae bacterium]|nr:DNA-processing protein DprA [Oscillospiraceae bacterium]
MTDAAVWIWFQLLFGIGTRRSHLMLEYFPDPASILEGIEKRGQVLSMLRPDELAACEETMRKAEEIKRKTLRKGCEIITPDHPFYPPLLQNIHAKPAALYVKGELTCLRDSLIIAMVGTRAYTEYGKDAGKKLAEELAACGVVIVSGLAKGIDSICHSAALEAGGKSIGILGCGIDVDYPFGSAPLKRGLVESGAVISEYPLGTEPKAANFPLRNRLISGMSDGTIVVEADMKSGSLLTATHALDQNRELFAVPGSIFAIREQGTHKLIRQGAKLTESALDVFEEFTYRSYPNLYPERIPVNPLYKSEESGQSQKKATAPQIPALNQPVDLPAPALTSPKIALPDEISPGARDIYKALSAEPKTVDKIAADASLNVEAVQSALTELEIYGLIIGYPGRRFSLHL